MKAKVLDLKPTQFAVGMLEVDDKIEAIREGGKKARRAFVEEFPVPVVKGPDGALFVLDHHHFLCVCYQLGIRKVKIKVVKDLSRSRMSYATFWKWMFKSRNAYPFCQFGEGPRKALYLPQDIRGLADDPYRSLAWFVRKAGAFENSDINFAEFKWANFFRDRGLLDRRGPEGMPEAIAKAVKLAQSPAAKRLPGYGKIDFKEAKAVVKRARARTKRARAKRKLAIQE